MLIHFRRTFEELSEAELRFARTALPTCWRRPRSYLSIVELGLYEMTGKIHEDLGARASSRGARS